MHSIQYIIGIATVIAAVVLVVYTSSWLALPLFIAGLCVALCQKKDLHAVKTP